MPALAPVGGHRLCLCPGESAISDFNDSDGDETGQETGPDIDSETLAVVQGVVRIISSINWFSAISTPLEAQTLDSAGNYLAALGFPDLGVAPLEDWNHAKIVLQEREWESAWGDAEDQARSAMAAAALDIAGEEVVSAAVAYVAEQANTSASDAIQAYAALLGGDPDLIDAAVNDAREAACQALLITLAEEDADHPLALKFKLYEAGRWPIGAVGSSFSLF